VPSTAPIVTFAVLGAAVAMGCAASANQPALEPELETPAPADEPPRTGSEATRVDIDLAPTGMAAWIRAPSTAKVRAAASEVEIVGGPEFHLLVGRGAIDPLGEKARIVRAFGDEFRRYLTDDGDLVVYETGTPQEQRYHFFMTARVRDLGYHCRTPPDGLPTRSSVDDVIDACRSVRFTEDAEVTAAPAG
jgi:hypothetical protein